MAADQIHWRGHEIPATHSHYWEHSTPGFAVQVVKHANDGRFYARVNVVSMNSVTAESDSAVGALERAYLRLVANLQEGEAGIKELSGEKP